MFIDILAVMYVLTSNVYLCMIYQRFAAEVKFKFIETMFQNSVQNILLTASSYHTYIMTSILVFCRA